jgi:short-subunit dehydrogenase
MTMLESESTAKRRHRCVIVGAGEGLGRSLAQAFAMDGCDIVLIGRSAESCAAAQAAAMKAAPDASIQVLVGDAARPDELESILMSAGDVDVMVYNVRGSAPMCPPLDIQQSDLEAMLRLEVGSALAAAKAVLPRMLARGCGTLIYSSATAAFRGSADSQRDRATTLHRKMDDLDIPCAVSLQ